MKLALFHGSQHWIQTKGTLKSKEMLNLNIIWVDPFLSICMQQPPFKIPTSIATKFNFTINIHCAGWEILLMNPLSEKHTLLGCS